MDFNAFLSIAISWLEYDTLANFLCVILAFAIFAIARNFFRQSH